MMDYKTESLDFDDTVAVVAKIDLETELSQMITELNKSEKQNERLKLNVNELRAEIAELQFIVVSKERKAVEKNSTIASLEKDICRLQLEVKALDTQQVLEAVKTEEMLKALQFKDDTIKEKDQNFSDLKKHFSDLQKQSANLIQGLKSELKTAEMLNKKFSESIGEKDEVIAVFNREAQKSNDKLAQLSAEMLHSVSRISELQIQVEISQRSMTMKDAAIAELNTAKSAALTKSEHLAKELAISNDRIDDLEQNIQIKQRTIEAGIHQLNRTMTEKDALIADLTAGTHRLSSNKSEALKTIEGLNCELESRRSKEKAQEYLISDIQQHLENIQQSSSSKIVHLGKSIAEKDTIIMELHAGNQNSLDRLNTFKSETMQIVDNLKRDNVQKTIETQNLENEIRRLHNELSTLTENKVTLQQMQFDSQKVDRRGQQLQFYAQTLNQEKMEVVQTAKQLIQELQTARNNNPIRDYLTATSRELSKIEIQLRKTPTISYERGYLENYLSQLVEQRDFLRSVIENSLRQVDRQTGSLMKIANNDKFFPCPPAPPKV